MQLFIHQRSSCHCLCLQSMVRRRADGVNTAKRRTRGARAGGGNKERAGRGKGGRG